MKQAMGRMVLVTLCWGCGALAMADPTLNYQGRITTAGANFTGFGYFKFVLVNGGGGGVWSNDGSGGAGEPAASVGREVNNGLFNVELGEGMHDIPPLVFHEYGLQLRTWFSTNNVVFEQLLPDVPIRPADFAQLNTGNLVVVAPDGTADFDNLQDAINCLAANNRYGAILVMPGYYQVDTPLVFPTNRWVYPIRGAADKSAVTIENTNGPAVHAERLRLENVQLRGNPAISDAASEPGYQFECRNCEFQRFSPGGPIIDLGTEGGSATFVDCRAGSDGGDAMRLSGDVWVKAKDCDFHVWSLEGSALRLEGKTRWIEFENCQFDTWQSGDPSVLVVGGSNASVNFRNCSFGAVVFTNSRYGANIYDSQLNAGLTIQGGGAQFRVDECSIHNSGEGQSAVEITDVDGEGHLWFRNCDMYVANDVTFAVKDVTGEVRVKDCEIHSGGGVAVKVQASAALTGDERSGIDLIRCRLGSYNNGGSADQDAVVVINDPANQTWQASVDLSYCDVEGNTRDGIRCDGGSVGLGQSSVYGEREGVVCLNGEFGMGWSSVEGGARGIVCSNSSVYGGWSGIYGDTGSLDASGNSEVFLEYSELSGGDYGPGAAGDGIHFDCASGNLVVQESTVTGSAEDPALGRGIYTVLAGGNGQMTIVNSSLNGSGPGVECAGGLLFVVGSTVHSGLNAAALLRYTNTVASLAQSTFAGMGTGNTNAAIVLYGEATNRAPVPKIANCTIMPDAQQGSAPYSIALAGTVTTGNVLLVNSTLSTNLDARVGIVPVRVSLPNGNVIP